jgi:hypothetical protein
MRLKGIKREPVPCYELCLAFHFAQAIHFGGRVFPGSQDLMQAFSVFTLKPNVLRVKYHGREVARTRRACAHESADGLALARSHISGRRKR